MRPRTTVVLLLVLALLAGAALPALAAPPDGTLAIGVHVTLVSRWLDPGDTEALITPFMVLYLLHDALVKDICETLVQAGGDPEGSAALGAALVALLDGNLLLALLDPNSRNRDLRRAGLRRLVQLAIEPHRG